MLVLAGNLLAAPLPSGLLSCRRAAWRSSGPRVNRRAVPAWLKGVYGEMSGVQEVTR